MPDAQTLAAGLLMAGAGVAGVLGALHLVFTYNGERFEPRDAVLAEAMRQVSPRISRQTTMWRAARGFHASHSLGVLLFTTVWIYLAGWQLSFLRGAPFLLILGQIVLLTYLLLARLYWFSIPLRGITLASLLYAAGWLALTQAG
ncbi:hypothetical protein J7U46_11380 [Pelomonas sp. V22]|uniref:LIC_13387 family protein n=1 Tax=Pelomonas sp. V22 TaxID=2822139 RepID=UPI0024A9C121|nr:hypothetical protein [Pelomonas sp. V22]MDI4633652.1 hypothetical protein [Pelomonas sp. V22]